MGKYLIFLALFVFIYEVQPLPLARLRRLARLRHAREIPQPPETTTEEPVPEMPPQTTKPPPTTLGFPPSNPNDECHGCPLGEVCRMVYPPCARPPPECEYPDPDNKIQCDDYHTNYSCNPVPICINYKYSYWFK